jgi:hypothetical protein
MEDLADEIVIICIKGGASVLRLQKDYYRTSDGERLKSGAAQGRDRGRIKRQGAPFFSSPLLPL